MPKADLRKVLGPEIPSFVKLLGSYTTGVPQTAGSLLEKMTDYGEGHLNIRYSLLMCLQPTFASRWRRRFLPS
jgi:hypothetical protein